MVPSIYLVSLFTSLLTDLSDLFLMFIFVHRAAGSTPRQDEFTATLTNRPRLRARMILPVRISFSEMTTSPIASDNGWLSTMRLLPPLWTFTKRRVFWKPSREPWATWSIPRSRIGWTRSWLMIKGCCYAKDGRNGNVGAVVGICERREVGTSA